MSDDSANQPQSSKSQPQSQQQQNQFQQQQQQFSAMPEMAKLGQAQSQSQSQGSVSGQDFFARYRSVPNVYDEVRNLSGTLRPQWTILEEELRQIGSVGMERRWKQVRRMVHQNGIAYSAYGDPSVRDQHLQLDPLPHLITTPEWKRIDEGAQATRRTA